MNGFLYAIKIYKTDPVSLSQSNNEMLMIPFVQRISGTSSNSIVPSLLQPTKIRGHPSLIMNLWTITRNLWSCKVQSRLLQSMIAAI